MTEHQSVPIPDRPDFHPQWWADTPRHPTTGTLTKAQPTDTGTTITIDGWNWHAPVPADQLTLGHTYTMLRAVNDVCALRNDTTGTLLWQLTDQQLADQRRAQLQKMHDQSVHDFELHKEGYAAIERDLPTWLQDRITVFREHGGEQFLLSGWGYELVIAQLADAMTKDADVNVLANTLGASGNQMGVARALVELHNEHGDNMPLTVSGLTPITGEPFYNGQNGPTE